MQGHFSLAIPVNVIFANKAILLLKTFLHKRLDLYRQTEEIDKALRIHLIVAIVLFESRHAFVIKRIRRLRAGVNDIALIKF